MEEHSGADTPLTITQYAEMHNIDRAWVWRLIKQGRIKATKIGSTWIIPAKTPKPTDKRVKTGKYVGWRQKQ